MLYELIAVVRPGNLAEVKEIARTAGTLILRSGGTVRSLTNWGVMLLPRRTRKHQANYHEGHHFIMRYDTSSAAQDSVRKVLAADPRMIRFSTVKLGNGKLDDINKVGSTIPWNTQTDEL